MSVCEKEKSQVNKKCEEEMQHMNASKTHLKNAIRFQEGKIMPLENNNKKFKDKAETFQEQILVMTRDKQHRILWYDAFHNASQGKGISPGNADTQVKKGE